MPLLPVTESLPADPPARSPSLAVDRRELLAQGALSAVAALLSSACRGLARGPRNVHVTVTLAGHPALDHVGGVAALAGVETPIAVVRSGAATFRAFSLVCPHAGSTLNLVGSGFRCPNHFATFDSRGANTGGQRTSDLYEFTVTHDARAGTITLTS